MNQKHFYRKYIYIHYFTKGLDTNFIFSFPSSSPSLVKTFPSSLFQLGFSSCIKGASHPLKDLLLSLTLESLLLIFSLRLLKTSDCFKLLELTLLVTVEEWNEFFISLLLFFFDSMNQKRNLIIVKNIFYHLLIKFLFYACILLLHI